jgi:hypothetical protein
MMNRRELELTLEVLKKEYMEALERGNKKIQNNIVNQILNLEVTLKEDEFKKNMKEVKLDDEVDFVFNESEAFRQKVIVKSFSNKLKELYKKYYNTTTAQVSTRQAETIMAGLRDRVGMDVDAKQIEFINNLNANQASEIIKVLSGISFYNQRLMLSEALETLKYRNDFKLILEEVKNNIHKREWFEHNKDLMAMSYELQEPTDAQIRRIADVAKYLETHETLESEFGINVQDFEYRAEDKLYYTFNWKLLKETIKTRFNRESAFNFIQTYDYITNYYEGNKLDNTKMNTLKNLYIQLGEYENTRLTYLCTIPNNNFDMICRDLESRIRLNKIANNKSTQRFRKAIMEDNTLVKFSARESREVRSLVLKEEQQQAKELTSFVFNIYACIGQEVPEEMTGILPYFVQGGEVKYALVEEQHYKEFRKMVFEQRAVIKEVNPAFNWGAFIANQPDYILRTLGLDMLM